MIGGKDVIIKTNAGLDALDVAFSTVKILWPNAVFEDALSGKNFKRWADLPLGTSNEFLIYKNEQVLNRWHKVGAEPELNGTLLHLILDHNELTVVIDNEPTPQIAMYVQNLKNALMQNSTLLVNS